MGIFHSICHPSVKPNKQVPVVVIFSGKRKSGKDYCTERLKSMLGPETAEIGRLSAPLKLAYAKEHNLDYKQLLSDGPYKEKYRKDMIRWGEERRNKDPGFFAKLVVASCARPVLIISDARRVTDIEFFKEPARGFYPITVRVEATEETRKTRGWVFTDGVDNVESECGLDGRNW
eukprot:CAMPEP_0185274090 /NCGR_PEP_ID=MMETSP1359-20130426/51039_1 /TAXON_ID=552665 /ORGANISM="Bigelowiella longifila, Strain CCMP242" /LENGTH=174 /DNA_ID=CAMNT_0027866941 /DNA_START=177 /DNA_END=698 /DNA_ORIENTATION=+